MKLLFRCSSGVFPEPNVDPIIQIANIVKLHGDTDPIVSNVFTLNTCAPIGHAEVHITFFSGFQQNSVVCS